MESYFLIDGEKFDKNIDECKRALSNNFTNYIVGYSVKTNSLPWLINRAYKNGCFIEVVSPDEYNIACELGIPKEHIIYNGPIKDKKTFNQAIMSEGIVNIDSFKELEWIMDTDFKQKVKIGIRINVDLLNLCPDESRYQDVSSRFGFQPFNDEFDQILNEVKNKTNVEIVGLHMHSNTITRGLVVYQKMTRLFCDIVKKYDLNVKYFDIGGGYNGDIPSLPVFQDYFSTIKKILCTSCENRTL